MSERLAQIKCLKQQTDTAILAHTYQPPEIIDLADITGDSFALAKAATQLPQQRIIVCGVRFMAETVHILAPEKEVILAAPDAGCPMATQIAPERVRAFKQTHPKIPVVVYINTTAALKAECDICVTSSSAVQIVRQLPQPEILFIPDRNLGAWVQSQLPEKRFILWEGHCPIHAALTEQAVLKTKRAHPNAQLAMHPECPPAALQHADMVGSTQAIIQYAMHTQDAVILGTERGVADTLMRDHPDREFYYLVPETLTCPDMKKTSVQMVQSCLAGEMGERITLPLAQRQAAKRSIDRMLELGG